MTRKQISPKGDKRTTAKKSDEAASHREKVLLIVVCVLAGLRVFVFSAAFPFFNNIDEMRHFDYVWKCAHGHLMSGPERYAPGTAFVIAHYSSPEYLHRRDDPLTQFPPPWTLSQSELDYSIDELTRQLVAVTNFEGVQPPLYYMVAGAWYRITEGLGLSLFSIRFMNILIVMLVVLLAYRYASDLYPDARLMRLGLPLLVGFVPQDLFYSIGNGVFSPLVCGTTLYCLILLLTSQTRDHWFYLLTGVMVAACLLVAYTNVSIFVLMLIAAVAKLVAGPRDLRRISAMVSGSLLPLAVWVTRNYVVLGAPTASRQYIKITKWVPLSPGEMLQHPIFTLHGFLTFWSDLMVSYFRGEFIWLTKRVASPIADFLYALVPSVLLIISIIILIYKLAAGGKSAVRDLICLLAFGLSVVVLIGMSVRYDFGNWPGPSRSYPYYSNGRLICGTMIPFFILLINGLDALLKHSSLSRAGYPILAAACALMTVSEILLTIPVFKSHYNWFHLVASGARLHCH